MQAKEVSGCPFCGGTGEMVIRPNGVIDYTFGDGESIDERLEPCTCTGFDTDDGGSR